ncbi:MAG: hypothetical protein OQK56_07330, partial [Ignavibacteriaceae bacterium]|nr:hypothetical protein [Ignavibacteriaceae bacterium]
MENIDKRFMKRVVQSSVMCALLFCISPLAQTNDNTELGSPIRAYLNLNNISTLFKNDGVSDINVAQAASGFVFPKGTGKTAVYQSGFLWGANLNRTGEDDPHVGGSVYRSGLQEGKIISQGVAEDPFLPHVRIYRVRPDVYPGGPPVDLSVEAIDEGKTEQEIRAQYELDWTEWRAQDGAPFDDVDENGVYNPNVDIPGIPGASQTIWFVANDLSESRSYYLYGTAPMGIEYQATYWEYNNGSYLDNLFFRKYKLINKSDVTFNDMYISMWSDPDVGDAGDDFVGCDTTLNIAYAYNADDHDAIYYTYPPPAVGFDLLQGPIDQFNKPLDMTAAYYFSIRDPSLDDPVQGSYLEGAVRFYRFMQGVNSLTGETIVNPVTGVPTNYMLSGDPLTGEGWVDGLQYGPGDRRFGLASGPFNMAVGDTQEVVIAEIAAIGFDRLQAIKILKYYDVLAQSAFDNGLGSISSLPPRTEVPKSSVSLTNWNIKLNWGFDAASVSSIENFNQEGVEFQGYNVYQLASPLPIRENAVRVATYDKVDGVTEIEGVVMDPETGLPVNGIQQHGSDSGIERTFLTNHDYIEDTYMKVGKKYYFAITAYTFNSNPLANPNNSESLMEVVEVTYYENPGGASYGDSINVIHSQGKGDGNVYAIVDDATKLTGDDYEVFFNQQTYYRNEDGERIPIGPGNSNNPSEIDSLLGSTMINESGYQFMTEDHWNLLNLNTQDTVLKDQTVIMGYDLYTREYVGDPIVEGFKISVDANYDDLTTMSNVLLNGQQLGYSELNTYWFNDNFTVGDFTRYGYQNGTAALTLPVYGGAGGTTDINVLQQDLEFRWTGVLTDTVINGNTFTITQSGGSIVTLFGASFYSLADHPLNPNLGLDQPFRVRIPFEVWNVDQNQQVNLVYWDKTGELGATGFAVWNQWNREYIWVVNTPYSTNLIDVTSQLVADNATWNVVYFQSDFMMGDVIKAI